MNAEDAPNKEDTPPMPGKTVLILEDNREVLDTWIRVVRDAVRSVRESVHVIGGQTHDEAWELLRRSEKEGNRLVLVLADQVKGLGTEGDRRWGITFLEAIRSRYPQVYRIMFSGQTERDEIQDVLDRGLIHDFEAKSAPTGEPEARQRIVDKIVGMVQGVNVGNVQNPSADQEFEQFVNQWIDSLPEGGNTQMRSFDGTTFRAGELKSNTARREDFRRAFEAAKLDRLILFTESTDQGEQT